MATRVSSGLYRIDDYTRRVLDRNLFVVVRRPNSDIIYNPGGGVNNPAISIDYFYGEVSTGTYLPDETHLLVTASYLPLSPVIGANSYSVDIEGDVLDATDFEAAASNGGFFHQNFGND